MVIERGDGGHITRNLQRSPDNSRRQDHTVRAYAKKIIERWAFAQMRGQPIAIETQPRDGNGLQTAKLYQMIAGATLCEAIGAAMRSLLLLLLG
eukprot:5417058-Pyramimonas_sp.AAC.1